MAIIRVDLSTLLNRREICHPTRLTAISVANNELRATLHGYIWWEEIAQYAESEITFVFSQLAGGLLDIDLFNALKAPGADEALEDFSITQSMPGDWTARADIEIYGQSPLADPTGLFARLHDYLQQEESYKSPRDFLNCPPGKLKRFVEITQSSLYLLARCPRQVSDFICAELDAQDVRHYKLEETNVGKSDPLLWIIRWSGAVFCCAEAYAEYD